MQKEWSHSTRHVPSAQSSVVKNSYSPSKGLGDFTLSFGRFDEVVKPKDLYYEQSETIRNLFGYYDYLPLVYAGFLEHINALVTNSATAQSIINQIATFTIGKGFYVKKTRDILGNEVPIELTEEQTATLYEVLKRTNTNGDNVLQVCRKLAYDFEQSGNGYAELDIVETGSGNTVFLEHMHTNFVRPFRTLDLRGPNFYGVSFDWSEVPFFLASNQTNQSYSRAVRQYQAEVEIPARVVDIPKYPMFSDQLEQVEEAEYGVGLPGELLDESLKSSMLHIKKYAPQLYFWGLPTWSGAKHWVELEYRISKFNVSKFKNGLTPSGILQIFGDLTDEERNKYIDEMRAKMTDTENDFKVIFQILENPDLKANWVPFEQTEQGYFMDLAMMIKEFIAIGFEFPLSLIQATAGQLGSNQQMQAEFEKLYNTKIYYIQQELLQRIVRPYLDTVADEENLPFLKEVELGFINIVPVSYAGVLDPNKILTRDEGREELGFPIEDEEDQAPTIEQEQTETDLEVDEQTTNLFKRFLNLFVK